MQTRNSPWRPQRLAVEALSLIALPFLLVAWLGGAVMAWFVEEIAKSSLPS